MGQYFSTIGFSRVQFLQRRPKSAWLSSVAPAPNMLLGVALPLSLSLSSLALAFPSWAGTCSITDMTVCGASGGNGVLGRSGNGGTGNGQGGGSSHIDGNGDTIQDAGGWGANGTGGAGAQGDGGAAALGGSPFSILNSSMAIGGFFIGTNGSGGTSGFNFGGGGGGGGTGIYASGNESTIISTATITGGAGGGGGDVLNNPVGNGGGGGGGGTGFFHVGTSMEFENDGIIIGGTGGDGGDGGFGGGGGAGADGLLSLGGAAAITNTGSITGGAGGVGGTGSSGNGEAGGGGTGVNLSGGWNYLTNSGTITGGTGNGGGIGVITRGHDTITNSGTISGALNGTTRATAIQFGGTDNILNLQAGSQINGDLVFDTGASATIVAQSGGLALENDLKLLSGSAVTFDTFAMNLSVSGSISGNGRVNLISGNTLTLSGTNTYSGGTSIYAGTLVADHETNGRIDTFGTGDLMLSGGRLYSTISGAITNSFTIASGAISTISAATGTTLRLGDTSGSSTLWLAGDLVVGVGGADGTVIWDRMNSTIFGSATISVASGTLKAEAGSSLGTITDFVSATRVGSNAVLDLIATGGTIQNLQDLTAGSGGTVTWAGNLTINGGSFSGDLDGQTRSSLLKKGSDTLVLSGNNHLTGDTIVSDGILRAGSATGLSANTSYIVNGGTLDLNGFGLTVSSLSGSGGSVALGSADLTVDQTSTTTYSGTINGTGHLNKSGSGTLTLAGNNIYTGGTTISSGTLVANHETGDIIDALGTGLVTLAGGRLHAMTDGTLSNSLIVAAGTTSTISAETGKTLTLSTATGQYFSLLGNLVIGATDAAGTVVMDAVPLNISPTAIITVANGRLTDNTNALGAYTASAAETRIVSGATLDLSAYGGTIRNLQDGSLGLGGTVAWGTSALVIDSGRFSGTLDNQQSGSLIKETTGTLVLNGDNSAFTGAALVRGGVMIIGDSDHSEAAFGGGIVVWTGAALGGYGTTGNATILSDGVLSPGNSIGTLTVDGDLTLKPGSALEIEIASNGASDRVDVTGTATVSGSNVSVTTIDPETSYQNGQLYHILTADGGISGEFAGVVSNSAFLDMSLVYGNIAADLKICLKTGCPTTVDPETPEPEQPSPALFTTVAQTRNQLATAGGLDTLAQTGSSLALYNTLLMLSADEARAAFDRLSGEAYASAKGVLINDSQFIRNAALGRLQQAFGGAPATPINALSYAGSQRHVSASASAIDAVAPASIAPAQNLYTAWGYAYGAWTRQDSDGNAGAVKSSVGGFVTGIDGAVLDTWRLGLLAGYSHSSFDMNDRASSGSSDNYTLGAYTGTEWTLDNGHALAFRSGLAYTWHDVDMNRSVAFPGFADNLTGDYNAGSFQVFGELGYKVHYGKALFEPYAGLAYVRLKTDSFNETGQTAASLSVHSGTTDTSFSTLGLRASTEFALGSVTATARTDLGWRHTYGDITPVSTASFIRSDAFTVSGLPIAEDAALIEAGLDFKLTEDATLGISYNGQFASGAKQNGFNAKLSVSF